MDLSHLFSTRVVNYSQLLAAGGALAAGVYFYTKRAGGEVNTVTVVEDQVEDQDTNEALVQPDQVTMCPESPPSSTPGDNKVALNSIQELQKERSELMELVNTLRYTVKEMGDDIIEANMKCVEIKMELIRKEKDFKQQEENMRILQLTYEEMKEELTQKLQDNQKALDCIPQLEKEKSELTELISSLHSSLKETGDQPIEANMKCDELIVDSQKSLDYIENWRSWSRSAHSARQQRRCRKVLH